MEMIELVKWLNDRTKEYDEGHPTVSDIEWDNKFFELVKLEQEAGYVEVNSPTQKVNWDAVSALTKVEHNHSMLSLAKTKDESEFINYFSNINPSKDIIGMLKLDGLTCSLRYIDGHLVSAETRGNGEIGEDITHNAKVNASIPLHISYREELIIDGEIICDYDSFYIFDEKNGGNYKNPRNFASGKIRSLDPKDSEPTALTFVAWNIIKGFEETNSFRDKLQMLEELGFRVTPWTSSLDWDWKEFLIDRAEELNYPIDGLVGRFDDIEFGNSLGSTGHHAKAAYAYKFYDEEYDTTLLDIEWSMGRTGILTPVAIFEPIDVDGTEIERASLHNVSILDEILKIAYVGQPIKVYKANMIIPQISWAKSFDLTNNVDCKIFDIPEFCPVCEGETEIKESESGTKNLICTNSQCEGKLINQLDHFCGKKGLDIKGLSKMTLEKLIDWGWVGNIREIFSLSNFRDEWIKKSGFGVKSVDNILAAIEASRNTTLDKFIAALGIPLIGTTAAKAISKKENGNVFNFFEDINTDFDFSTLDNFGYEMNKTIHSFDYSIAKELCYNAIIEIEETKEEEKSNGLEGLVFVITGKLSRKRDDIKADIEAKGGKVTGSVSSRTSYLVCNDKNSNTGKSKDAKNLGIPIITEEELNNLG